MSNKIETPSEEVKIRHQATVPKHIADQFMAECQKRRWDPATLLRVILEQRYGSGDA